MDERTHIVQSTDTLVRIALKYDLSVAWLKEINNLLSDYIAPGTVLKISPIPDHKKPVEPVACEIYGEKDNSCGYLKIYNGRLEFCRDNKTIFSSKLAFHNDSSVIPHPNASIPEYQIYSRWRDMGILIYTYRVDSSNSNNTSSIMLQANIHKLKSFYQSLLVHIKQSTIDEELLLLREQELACRQRFRSLVYHHSSSLPIYNQELNVIPEKNNRFRRKVFYGGSTKILTGNNLTQIRRVLPDELVSSDWKLILQSECEKISYMTLLDKISRLSSILILIKTEEGKKFGMYLDSWTRFPVAATKSFLFRLEGDDFTSIQDITNNGQFIANPAITGIEIGFAGLVYALIDRELCLKFVECEESNSSQDHDCSIKIELIEVWKIEY